jgi:hypothetical protein
MGSSAQPVRRERVLHAGRQLGKGFAAHHTVVFQLLELLGEHFARDERHVLRQLPKAHTALAQVGNKNGFLLAPEHAYGAGHGAGRGTGGDVFHGKGEGQGRKIG